MTIYAQDVDTHSRRSFLGATATGLAVGAGGFLAGQAQHSLPPNALAGQALETASAAANGESVARYGTHRVVYSFSTTENIAAISFDDGPDPRYTPRILDALDKAGIKATFFAMGYNAQLHKDILKDVVAAGHEVGNHSWSHLDQAYTTAKKTRLEIVDAKHVIEDIIGQPTIGYRPPRGDISGSGLKVCAQLGYDVYIWSCTRGRGGVGTPESVSKYIADTMQAGDVVDLHDSTGRGVFSPGEAFAKHLDACREVEVRALPQTLARIAAKGLRLCPVTTALPRSQA